ncbi:MULTISPECIES: F0F1 ATP synthase subunit alpha [Methylosinus]|uniref:ATP synthase subunit alpha n=1 Tax=Methylosinus trichosporium (strain ATCC 35070 / NCIMB 11131 / UNIQEM 75 / OB3b) TaxID=595536 RepID=A0A2D2CUW0_METT3|nr:MULTISPECIES: F0F1 ATP synthase subunit alpha [Methylosinus]ATQ66548.1 F0F1 ATP synthase subunit alpha [Methylosinus trichosporium OB3b]OBS52615.1 F0F1 ATP synthase subunit alpha [Methylosinus sp. 3S-1]
MSDEPAVAEWLARGRAAVARIDLGPKVETVGRVESYADGIAFVSGLPQVALDELLRFETGQLGFARALEADRVAVVLLDPGDAIEAGARVFATGEVARTPVGEGLLGRVVDPLGRPLDGGEPIAAVAFHPVEREAPSIIARDLVTEPVETGLLVVDSMFALGRGQRELVIGDRATGKTSIAIDAIINQRHSDIVCVYVAIGQRTTSVERAIEAVRSGGAADRTIFVVAPAASPPGLQWIAPFAGFAMAEFFRDRGGHALVVVDDLSKHAVTHRELALLTREPPGREAYPGDIFYVHARLLERAAKLSKALGGGSLTALPIAETDSGNLSAYIPTNLISITDGQIVLDRRLFAANHRPAVDVGLSVSRVGGRAQPDALRDVSGRLRLQYTQFLELEMFSRFGGMSNARIEREMTRGERIRGLLTQPRFSPLRLADQVALLAALDAGVLDPVPARAIPALTARLPAHLDSAAAPSVAAIARNAPLDEAMRADLVARVRDLSTELTAHSS